MNWVDCSDELVSLGTQARHFRSDGGCIEVGLETSHGVEWFPICIACVTDEKIARAYITLSKEHD